MAWQDPSDASAYCTGFAATSAPPRAGGSSTLKVCAPVLTSTSVTPTSVPCAVNAAWALAGSSVIALRVSAMSASNDIVGLPVRRSYRSLIVYQIDLDSQELPGFQPGAGTRVGHILYIGRQ